jgi:hypothetical protein
MMHSRTDFLLHGSNANSNMPIRAPWDPTLQSEQYRPSYPLLISKMMLEMAQLSEEGRDDKDERCGDQTLVPSSPDICPTKPELAKPVMYNWSSYIFVTNELEIINSASSLTASEHSSKASTHDHHHTEPSTSDSLSLEDGEEVIGPLFEYPVTQTSNSLLGRTCEPYAQLCFDPEQNTLVTLMEVHLASADGRQSKRLCIVDPEGKSQAKGWLSDPNTSGTDCTASDCSEDDLLRFGDAEFPVAQNAVEPEGPPVRRFDESIVYSTTISPETLSEEVDVGLYLLHECQDPWNMADRSQGGCTEALKKLLVVSRSSLKVFKSRSEHEYSTQEPFSAIGYAFLQEI